MKTSTRVSVIVSMSLTVLLGLFMLGMTCFLEKIVAALIGTKDQLGAQNPITQNDRAVILWLAFAMIVVALVALVCLFLLLRTVLRGMVFSRASTGYLFAIMLCCFAEGLITLPLGRYFLLAFGVVMLFFFIGLCLMVVRNVIAEATRIKQENDLTV